MKHCKLTNLLSENKFGDLDLGMFKHRNVSVHYHSGIQMVKRNKTISTWLASKPLDQARATSFRLRARWQLSNGVRGQIMSQV